MWAGQIASSAPRRCPRVEGYGPEALSSVDDSPAIWHIQRPQRIPFDRWWESTSSTALALAAGLEDILLTRRPSERTCAYLGSGISRPVSPPGPSLHRTKARAAHEPLNLALVLLVRRVPSWPPWRSCASSAAGTVGPSLASGNWRPTRPPRRRASRAPRTSSSVAIDDDPCNSRPSRPGPGPLLHARLLAV